MPGKIAPEMGSVTDEIDKTILEQALAEVNAEIFKNTERSPSGSNRLRASPDTVVELLESAGFSPSDTRIKIERVVVHTERQLDGRWTPKKEWKYRAWVFHLARLADKIWSFLRLPPFEEPLAHEYLWRTGRFTLVSEDSITDFTDRFHECYTAQKALEDRSEK